MVQYKCYNVYKSIDVIKIDKHAFLLNSSESQIYFTKKSRLQHCFRIFKNVGNISILSLFRNQMILHVHV